MSKRTIGLVAGLAVASVAAFATPLGTAQASGTASSTASQGSAFSPDLVRTVGGTTSVAAARVPLTTARPAAKPAPKPPTRPAPRPATKPAPKPAPRPAPRPAPKPPVARIVRQVRLQLPTSAVVGSNVTGFVQVLDDNGQVQSPVANVDVAFQRKDGVRWTDLSEDLTDENGTLPVAFMSQTNMTVRAVYRPAKGAPIISRPLVITSASQVTWAARPDMDVAAKRPVTYAFRINSGIVPTAHLEFASSANPAKWTPGTSVAIAPTGVATASLTFPAPGTYLVRGTTGRSATNAPGYTSTITVTVS